MSKLDLLAGGLSGMTVDFVLFPIDTIKSRLQARQSPSITAPKLGASIYRGLLSAMTISFPSAALFWTAYTGFKRRLQGDEPTSSPLSAAGSHAIAAGAADVMVCLIRNPFEVVKQQMQVGLHRTTREAVRSIVRLDGARGLYAGFWSTIARDIPFDACQFVMYEHLKGELMTYRGRELRLWENMALGFLCGGVAAAVTTPLDVAKTRLMTQTHIAASAKYTGVIHALKSIAAEGGMHALFSGVKPRVAWISCGGAIFIGSFEEFSRMLRRA